MIYIDGQLCYSPFSPERYGTGQAGIGVSCRHDVQLWNLVYLTGQAIEDHLDPSQDAAALDLVRRDSLILSLSQTALYGPNCRELFPGLRDALKQHPRVFLCELRRMPWQSLPQVRWVPEWSDIVVDKVADISARFHLELFTSFPGLAGNFFGKSHGRKHSRKD